MLKGNLIIEMYIRCSQDLEAKAFSHLEHMKANKFPHNDLVP